MKKAVTKAAPRRARAPKKKIPNPAAQALGRLGGTARKKTMSPAQRSASAQKAIYARYGKPWPPPDPELDTMLGGQTQPATKRCDCGSVLRITPTADPYAFDYACTACTNRGIIAWAQEGAPPPRYTAPEPYPPQPSLDEPLPEGETQP